MPFKIDDFYNKGAKQEEETENMEPAGKKRKTDATTNVFGKPLVSSSPPSNSSNSESENPTGAISSSGEKTAPKSTAFALAGLSGSASVFGGRIYHLPPGFF